MKTYAHLPLMAAFAAAFISNLCRADEPQSPQTALAKAIDLYSKAWLEPDPALRAQHLEQAWAKDGQYKDPSVTLKGGEALSLHIAEFLKKFSGAKFTRTSPIDSHGSSFRFTWLLNFPDGNALQGLDIGEIDRDGKITAITGFFGPLPDQITQTNQAIVATYMDALFRKFDLERLDQVLAKNVTYTQAPGLPYGGTYTGLSEMMKMFGSAQSHFSMEIVGEPKFYADQQTVIVLFTIKCWTKKTSRQLSMYISECFELKDGKIIAITPSYFDTKTFVEFLNEEKPEPASTPMS